MHPTLYFKKMYSWFFPSLCILCASPGSNGLDLCSACLKELPILPQTCPRCAKTLVTNADDICSDCLRSPPPYDCAHALFLYQKPITKLIMELKFHERLVNAQILGKLMAAAVQDWYCDKPLPELIIPVPLHRSRLKERGFNQSLEIARPIAKALKLAINTSGCQRIRHTQAQARLHAKERSQNMKNAFVMTEDFSKRHIAVLDDVTTTGHSINEFTKTLKQAGNPKIDVWFCARAIL